jgi:hypothetical protein
MSFTASAAETTFPFSLRLRKGRAGWSITLSPAAVSAGEDGAFFLHDPDAGSPNDGMMAL